MAIFRRKNKGKAPDDTDGTDEAGKDGAKKGAWKRPANTAFKQQRLKAWQPILTPKTVLPMLFIIGILFAPIGALLIWGSNQVSSFWFDYTECDASAPTDGTFADMPSNKYHYSMRSSDSSATYNAPQWTFSNDSSISDVSQQAQCRLRFDVPADLHKSVFMYYGLTNFYQNHRRYVKSYDAGQLKGDYRSASTLNDNDCKPLAEIDGKAVYPCGLIANSVFNDTFSLPALIGGSSNTTYNMTDKGIAWSGESKKYTNTPGYSDLSEIVPPPNWRVRYPSYNESNIPKLADDEHFQNWMRTAGLDRFTKLYYRNDDEDMAMGTYEMTAYMNYPVKSYGGTKKVVFSTVSWIGGKNPFMGWAYVATSILFVILGIAGTVRHLVKPRKLGDMTQLSWNQPVGTTR